MIPDSYFERFSTPKYRTRSPLKRGLIRRFVAQVHELFLEAQPAATVLEVGVGEGFISGWLSERFPEKRFVGVDLSAGDLGRLQQKFPRIETHCANVYDVAGLGVRPDLVICCEVLEHLDDPARGLRAMLALGPRQGIFTVPHEPWFMLSNLARGQNVTRLGNDPEHVQHFTPASFRRLLAAQAQVERTATSYPWLLARVAPRA